MAYPNLLESMSDPLHDRWLLDTVELHMPDAEVRAVLPGREWNDLDVSASKGLRDPLHMHTYAVEVISMVSGIDSSRSRESALSHTMPLAN